MKDLLVLLDNWFPFKNEEAFLESEEKYYDFSKVIICPFKAKGTEEKRSLHSENTEYVHMRDVNKSPVLRKISRHGRAIFSIDFWKEFFYLIRSGKLSRSTLISLIVFIGNGKTCFSALKKHLSKMNLSEYDRVYIYSYWLHFQAYSAVKLKKYIGGKSMVFSRAHRFDIYEYANAKDYIPLRKYILNGLDKVVTIAKDGKDYLSERYPEYKDKIELYRLGTLDNSIGNFEKDKHTFTIVSCSRVVKVKRLHLIVEALKQITDKKIHWIHFGGGELFEDIKKIANEKLMDKITFDMRGPVFNTEILKYYKNANVDLFINVSDSEGLPVSIMEAQSFGIPVIATNVGGTAEIVIENENGFLLKKDFEPKELATKIKAVINMPEEDYMKLRKNARSYWEENYKSETNYPKFVEFIKNI